MVSGYHDPVTARFIEETNDVRDASEFPAECFERRAVPSPWGDEPIDSSEPLTVDDVAPTSLVEPASRI